MPRLRRYTGVALVTCLLGAALCTAADGADRKSADVQVWAIRATTKNSDIDPQLKPIADMLKKQFKYTGFKLEKTATGKADIGKTFTAALVSGYTAKVTPKRHDGKQVQLEIEIWKGGEKKFGATVTIAAGHFQLCGGWKLDSTDALIVAVSAR